MSGPNARYGSFSLRGAQLATEEINAAGGIGGRKIAISSGDSQGTPVEGVSATRRLIDLDKVDFIIGDVSSSVTLAMQPVAEDAGGLLLNAASSNPEDHLCRRRRRVQMDLPQLSDRREPRAHRHPVCRREARLQKVCRSFRRQRLWPRGDRVHQELPSRLKGEILSEDYYKEGEVDFRSVLAKIRDSGAQAIIMYGHADTTPIIGRQMIEARPGRQGAADRQRGIQHRKHHQRGAEGARRRR